MPKSYFYLSVFALYIDEYCINIQVKEAIITKELFHDYTMEFVLDFMVFMKSKNYSKPPRNQRLAAIKAYL